MMLEIICEAFGGVRVGRRGGVRGGGGCPDLANGGGVAHGGCVLSVQLWCVVVQVQSLDGHHHPGHLAGIVCREEGEMSLVKLGDTLCRSRGHND